MVTRTPSASCHGCGAVYVRESKRAELVVRRLLAHLVGCMQSHCFASCLGTPTTSSPGCSGTLYASEGEGCTCHPGDKVGHAPQITHAPSALAEVGRKLGHSSHLCSPWSCPMHVDLLALKIKHSSQHGLKHDLGSEAIQSRRCDGPSQRLHSSALRSVALADCCCGTHPAWACARTGVGAVGGQVAGTDLLLCTLTAPLQEGRLAPD